MRFWKLLVPVLASSLSFAAQSDRITGTIDSGQRVTLTKSLHPKAQPQYDLGPVDPAMQLTYMTMLMEPSPSQQAALDLLLAQQQDRRSPYYHKWLTPHQFADRFGLSQNDLNRVTEWLKSGGFQILAVGGGRNSVSFSGTAAQVQQAFGAEIHKYEVNGKERFANSTPLLIPSALSGVVRTVTGMHNFLPHPASRQRVSRRQSHPDYFDSKFGNLLAPGDIATFYDMNPLLTASPPIDGTNQKLAIVGQTDVYLSDIADFRTGFSLNPITGCTTNANGVITACNSTYFAYALAPGSTELGFVYNCGDLGEADLDIEWSGAAAPGAQVVFVNSPVTYDANCNPVSGGGVNASLTAAINPPSGPPLAPVVSMSYGICEREAQDLETLLQQGNAEGVTIMNSSGDIGAASCDFNPPNSRVPFEGAVGGLAVSYPASSPEVTGVGGTEVSIADDAFPPSSFWSNNNSSTGRSVLSYIPEILWNDDVEIAQYCQMFFSQNSFCTTGGSPPVSGWVPLESSATAQQVQEDIWLTVGGGGASNCFTESNTGVCEAGFAQPSWQSGLTVPLAPTGVRWVPDVSIMASPNFPGYIFCTAVNPTTDGSTCASGIPTAIETFTSIVGGTSASSPIFAGFMTLLNQYVVSKGVQGTPGLGNINPMLYALAASPSDGAFHAVTSGTNDAYCQPNTPSNQPAALQCPAAGVFGYNASNFDATTDYNLVAGLGSVDINSLAVAWVSDFTLQTTSNLSPSSVSAGHSASATLTVSPVNGSTETINFKASSCSGLPTGATCSFNPTSVTLDGTNSQTVQLTIATLPNMVPTTGAQTITVTGGGSGINTNAHAATVSLTVTATTESFTLTPTNGSTFAVMIGGTAPVALTVNSSSGFLVGAGAAVTTAAPLTYTCTGVPALAPAEISCQLPNAGQPDSAPAVTVSLITTPVTTQVRPPVLGRHSGMFVALLLPGLLGIVFVAGKGKSSLGLLGLIVALGFSTLWLGSCGGSNNSNNSLTNPGTPPGTYMVTINATTGGGAPLTGSTSITFKVTVTQ